MNAASGRRNVILGMRMNVYASGRDWDMGAWKNDLHSNAAGIFKEAACKSVQENPWPIPTF